MNIPPIDIIIDLVNNVSSNKEPTELAAKDKPHHSFYLRNFRVYECKMFKEHKCPYHKPYTCFFWHFNNQRRRLPYSKDFTKISYSHDKVCKAYDNVTGICSNNDECKYVHYIYGDMERLFHPFYYKTTKCIYNANSDGMCAKNGIYCAFYHYQEDYRNVEEIYKNTSVLNLSYFQLLNKNICIDIENIQIEKTAEDIDWNNHYDIINYYKTLPCELKHSKKKDSQTCPYYHNSKDIRRSLKTTKYAPLMCKNKRKENEWNHNGKCQDDNDCIYSHNKYELEYHPDLYKNKQCEYASRNKCNRSQFCPYIHDMSDNGYATSNDNLTYSTPKITHKKKRNSKNNSISCGNFNEAPHETNASYYQRNSVTNVSSMSLQEVDDQINELTKPKDDTFAEIIKNHSSQDCLKTTKLCYNLHENRAGFSRDEITKNLASFNLENVFTHSNNHHLTTNDIYLKANTKSEQANTLTTHNSYAKDFPRSGNYSRSENNVIKNFVTDSETFLNATKSKKTFEEHLKCSNIIKRIEIFKLLRQVYNVGKEYFGEAQNVICVYCLQRPGKFMCKYFNYGMVCSECCSDESDSTTGLEEKKYIKKINSSDSFE